MSGISDSVKFTSRSGANHLILGIVIGLRLLPLISDRILVAIYLLD